MKTICFVANSSWYLHNFRNTTIQGVLNLGYECKTIAPLDGYESHLSRLGAVHVHWRLKRKSTNIVSEIISLIHLFLLITRYRPSVVFTFTPKANLYVGLLSRFLPFKFIPNVSGLGYLFNDSKGVSKLVVFIYKLAFKSAKLVYFQNEEDRELFVNFGVVSTSKTCRIFGSGVNLERFKPVDLPVIQRSKFRIIFCARLLKDKGLQQFADAGYRIISKYKEKVDFDVLGIIDSGNPLSYTKDDICNLEINTGIRYIGSVDDVDRILKNYDCLVLPTTYREGIPKAVIEAAATGLVLVVSDANGVRDAVSNGENGYLLKDPKSVDELVDVLERLIELDCNSLATMKLKSRQIAENIFDEKKIIDSYLAQI